MNREPSPSANTDSSTHVSVVISSSHHHYVVPSLPYGIGSLLSQHVVAKAWVWLRHRSLKKSGLFSFRWTVVPVLLSALTVAMCWRDTGQLCLIPSHWLPWNEWGPHHAGLVPFEQSQVLSSAFSLFYFCDHSTTDLFFNSSPFKIAQCLLSMKTGYRYLIGGGSLQYSCLGGNSMDGEPSEAVMGSELERLTITPQ